MSKKVAITKVCDGGPLDREHPATRTVPFSLGADRYEADYCDSHAKAIEHAFAPFILAGRRASSPSSARRDSNAKRTPALRRHSAEMRAWAKDRGLVTGDRGRMPDSVVARYEAAKRGQR